MQTLQPTLPFFQPCPSAAQEMAPQNRTAQEAQEYGFIDQVITSAREAADAGRPAHTKD